MTDGGVAFDPGHAKQARHSGSRRSVFAVTLLPVPADELRLVITKTALRMSRGAIFLRKIKTAEASLLLHTVLFFPLWNHGLKPHPDAPARMITIKINLMM